MEVGEEVCLTSSERELREVEESRVSGLDVGAVGESDFDAVGGRLFVNAGAVDLKEVAGASRVRYGIASERVRV